MKQGDAVTVVVRVGAGGRETREYAATILRITPGYVYLAEPRWRDTKFRRENGHEWNRSGEMFAPPIYIRELART